MNEQLNQQERSLRQIHEKNIENEEKTKEIYVLINKKKEGKVDRVETMEQMERRMNELKREKAEIDGEYYKQIKLIEKQKKELVYEQEKNMLVMREKEKE